MRHILYYTQYKIGGDYLSNLLDSLSTELRRGTLTLAVLSQLQTQQYGYSLVQLLEKSGIAIEQSTLYPLLRRLEKQELVESIWDTTESRPRKYYILTDFGVEVYEKLKEEWIKNSKELYKLLEGDDRIEID